ncbi:MAG: BREX-1 system adenine-specific DNA-methyltransferase PglX [Clostridiales bacterium]|nr:BREX-1 system adenine-specific DNA-methyltransferase PglX [Clostridiales bacterium]
MDKRALQLYAMWAKDNLEKQVEVSLKMIGINGDTDIKESRVIGDYTVIENDPISYPKELHSKRQMIVELIKSDGYKTTIEEFAYTWFNRFVSLRFMEVHDFLPHGFRLLSSREGSIEPEILKNLPFVKDDLELDLTQCEKLKATGIEDLYRYVLFRQCKALSGILPMLFEADNDCLELLLPKTLLLGDTVITKLVALGEDVFLEDIEVIGWLYQFYISAKKDAVYKEKKTITKDTLPAVTQLFTPDWIVRYMAENSLGRLWLESYPASPLRNEMKYFVPEAVQPEEVQRKIDSVKYTSVNPEDIKIIEPCCGSGHILVYVFDLLYKIYEEKGYQKRDIPTLILSKNICGLDVDKRASQLAAFSLVMKARSVNPRFFNSNYYVKPQVYEIWDSRVLHRMRYKKLLEETNLLSAEQIEDIEYLAEQFRYAKTIGSLLKIKQMNWDRIDNTINILEQKVVYNVFNLELLNIAIPLIKRLVVQAKILANKYDVMITNPPYIGISSMESQVKDYAVTFYPNSKTDMFAMFMETEFVKPNGFCAMINMHSWMFLSSYENLRKSILMTKEIVTMAHLGARAFETIGGEVVQTTTFVIRNGNFGGNGVYFRLVDSSDKENDFLKTLRNAGGGGTLHS